jgi:hypothetical protein
LFFCSISNWHLLSLKEGLISSFLCHSGAGIVMKHPGNILAYKSIK